MAVVAIIAAGDMCWVLAGCDNAVVARAASTDNLGVIHGVCWHPDIGIVAVFANLRCQNMRRVFASYLYAVVAACAIAGDTNVIEIRGQPPGC